MKTQLKNPHNIIFLLLIAVTIFTTYRFFSWHVAELPGMPDTIKRHLSEKALPGEAVFLGSALLDHLVWEHPELNIYPDGSAPDFNGLHNFYVLTYDELPDRFDDSEMFEKQLIAEEDSVMLYRFKNKNAHFIETKASTFFDRLSVTSTYSPDQPIDLLRGRFKTGPESWMYVGLTQEKFKAVERECIWAHPLDKAAFWIKIIFPGIAVKDAAVFFEGGIVDKGLCPGCSTVTVKITQEDQEVVFDSGRRGWKQKSLDSFSSDKPVTVYIEVPEGGKRHFCMDMSYRITEQVKK